MDNQKQDNAPELIAVNLTAAEWKIARIALMNHADRIYDKGNTDRAQIVNAVYDQVCEQTNPYNIARTADSK